MSQTNPKDGARGADTVESIDPSTGESVAAYPLTTESEVAGALDRAAGRAAGWAHSSWAERSALMSALADRLRDRRGELAALMSTEMGKPITESYAEVDKCAWVCDHYAEHGDDYLSGERLDAGDGRSVSIRFRPLGVVLAVMPWNYPLWQVFRCAAPIVSGGNAMLLKHASNVTGCGLEIERVFAEAGAPDGLFQTLVVPGSRVGGLIADDRIAAATITGSDAAGAAVGRAAGEAVKPVVLELGGSDPFIVLADADVERAAEVAVTARFQNTGQSCIAAKRFIVAEEVADRFESALVEGASRLEVGPPLEESTAVGPMAREDLRDELHRQVEGAVGAGAELIAGGEVPDRPGAWYPPTVLRSVEPGSPAFDAETFGPLAAITRAEGEERAIELANRTRYGLGASLWTSDTDSVERLSSRIEAGMVFVNSMTASDPRLPFGGVKASGHGRELGGRYGMREFLNAQTVSISEVSR